MRDKMPKLPDTELEVMQAIWACTPPVSRAEIENQLQESHPMAQTTLLTLLTRLSERGFVRIEKVGRRSQYIPFIAREDYLADQGHRFLTRLCGGSISDLASALCGSGLTRQEIEELRELLKEGKL